MRQSTVAAGPLGNGEVIRIGSNLYTLEPGDNPAAYDGASGSNATGGDYVAAPQKMAAAFRVGTFNVALSGTVAANAGTNALPAIGQIYIGSELGGVRVFTGIYREIKVWKRGFSAAETEAITE